MSPAQPAIRRWVEAVLAVCALFLCWQGINWALAPGQVLLLDEIGNLVRIPDGHYWSHITLLPLITYNDRPVGFVFERLLFDVFGFNYQPQLIVFLAIQLANCGLGFLLFRRLGLSLPLSIAAIGVFGSLSTTAQSATNLGAVFDVAGLFFVLACALAFLSEKHGSQALSAGLYLLALRTKEFAIVLPALLAILAFYRLPESTVGQKTIAAIRRLWMHLAIGIIFGIRYAFLLAHMPKVGPEHPYHMQIDFGTILKSLSYYTALVFGAEESGFGRAPYLLALCFATVLAYAVYRRRIGLVFGLASYVLLLLPVCLLPNQRFPFYVYAPQMFLLLMLALLLQEVMELVSKRDAMRWASAVVIALAAMVWAVTFRRSSYFTDRTAFTLAARKTSAKTAIDATALLTGLARGSRVYISHGDEMPWLFVPGPCEFLRVVNDQRLVTCELNGSEDQLRTSYTQDHSPKYLLNYNKDGSLTMLAADPRGN